MGRVSLKLQLFGPSTATNGLKIICVNMRWQHCLQGHTSSPQSFPKLVDIFHLALSTFWPDSRTKNLVTNIDI